MPKLSRKTCPPCKKKFTLRRHNQLYCSARCTAKANRRKKEKLEFHNTAFGSWLVRKCQISKTVQILTDVDLPQLYTLWLYCKKANGLGIQPTANNPRYEISHIAPATDAEVMGTLHPLNLVVAPGPYNRERHNAWDGHSGKWISLHHLSPEWEIEKGDKVEAVSKLIQRFIPESFERLLAEFRLQLSAREKMLARLVLQGVGIKSALTKLSYEQLEDLSKANPVFPKRSTMIKKLLERPLSAPAEQILSCMSDSEIEELYTGLIQPKRFTLPRATPYQVYVHEAKRMGLNPVEYFCFDDNQQEFWDHVHGAPLTVEFSHNTDNDYRNYY